MTPTEKMQRQDGERQTAFAVRLIQHDAWLLGHDATCTYSLAPCVRHPSPYLTKEADRG